jgi:lipid-A-disaccharide synthase
VTLAKDTLKIGIVAGEHSGDILGSKLIEELSKSRKIELFGVGGPKIESLGLESMFDFKHLQIMGLIEPLMNYKQLTSNRKKLIKTFTEHQIDIFIGIDSPDFNIGIHKALKKQNICKNIQLVSPSVWGWRQGRIKNIKKFIDHTVCLFDFEHKFYTNKEHSSSHLGHPFGDIQAKDDEKIIREYSLDPSMNFIAILPGSRESEINHMMPTYIDFMKLQIESEENTFFLIPVADDSAKLNIENYLSKTKIPFLIKKDAAKDFLSLSKKSVITSGTASLEAALLNAGPVICYKTNPINFSIISSMLKVKFIGLPNLLLKKEAFPELIQAKCTGNSIFDIIHSHHFEDLSYELRLALKGDGFAETASKILNLN